MRADPRHLGQDRARSPARRGSASPEVRGEDAYPSDGRLGPVPFGTRIWRWLPEGVRTARWDPGRQAAIVLLGVAVLVVGAVALVALRSRPGPAPLVPPATLQPIPRASVSPTPSGARTLVVAVVGKVRRPGVVSLREGARVTDALRAAGGLLPGADPGLLNLARRLVDGEQVIVGLPGVAPVPPPGAPGGPAEAAAPAVPVNLNTAALAELEALPGIGPVTAQRILDWRSEHGSFASVEQLQEVDGIGPAKLAQVQDRVTV